MTNLFYFDNLLVAKLPEVVRTHAGGRAALVFCNSRKMTANAAAQLAKQLGNVLQQATLLIMAYPYRIVLLPLVVPHAPERMLQAGGAARRQRLLEVSARLRDPKLRELASCRAEKELWS